MTWWDGRLVAYDCETTGVDLDEARIVTASIVLCGGGQPTETHTWLANPGVPIPDEASAVHGITTAHAVEHGEFAGDVVQKVLTVLDAETDERPLIAFNSVFDLTILDREARRYGLKPLTMDGTHVVDPSVIDRHLDRFRPGSRRLEAVCEHYGVKLPADDAHTAQADALAAARLAYVVCSRGEVVRRVRGPEEGRERAMLRREWDQVRSDLRMLHEMQVKWAWHQADGLREHFRRQGKTEAAESVTTHWPLVPFHARGDAEGVGNPPPAHAEGTSAMHQ